MVWGLPSCTNCESKPNRVRSCATGLSNCVSFKPGCNNLSALTRITSPSSAVPIGQHKPWHVWWSREPCHTVRCYSSYSLPLKWNVACFNEPVHSLKAAVWSSHVSWLDAPTCLGLSSDDHVTTLGRTIGKDIMADWGHTVCLIIFHLFGGKVWPQ